jgi:hypothetical protein
VLCFRALQQSLLGQLEFFFAECSGVAEFLQSFKFVCKHGCCSSHETVRHEIVSQGHNSQIRLQILAEIADACTTVPEHELRAAGFVGLNYDKLGDIHCFQVNGVELRQLQLTGVKPAASKNELEHFVLYRGPHACVTDEAGPSLRTRREEVRRSEHMATLS